MQPPRLTDRTALARNRLRGHRDQHNADFLKAEAADALRERLKEVNRSFTKPAIVAADGAFFSDIVEHPKILADKGTLDLAAEAHDLVIHALALHWADDPLGQIIQARRALKPDGLFLAVLFGGNTLQELRVSLAEAESSLSGGLSPRIAPMADVRDLGGLLQRAGLALPVADTLSFTVSYESIRALAKDLRAMGENNALADRLKHPASRPLFERAEQIYRTRFPERDGRIRATFELVFLTGWAPHPSQQKALKPGSATTALADALSQAASQDATNTPDDED